MLSNRRQLQAAVDKALSKANDASDHISDVDSLLEQAKELLEDTPEVEAEDLAEKVMDALALMHLDTPGVKAVMDTFLDGRGLAQDLVDALRKAGLKTLG